MKKIGFSFLVVLIVLFTGCSQKEVEVDTKEEVKPKVEKSVEKKEEVVQAQVKEEQTNSTQNVEVATTPVKEVSKTEEKKKAPKLNNIYFDYDKVNIRENMRDVLKTNYERLVKSEYKNTITLEGHCDERGSNEYNFALGLKRAQSVKNELIEYGIDPSQIKIISFGENQPLCSKATKNCWAKNRRVESVLD